MHEMSIAMEIVKQVLEVAEQHQATRVEEVEVGVGVMRQVVPEALEIAFEAFVQDTLARDARLKITEDKIVAVCRQCDCLFLPAVDTYVCPQCNQADARIVAGNDLILRSVVCKVEQEVPVP